MKSQYDKGDKEASKKLAEAYLPLVERIASQHFNSYISFEELYQEGCLGLMEAIERFDPSLEFTLGAFAEKRITGSILAAIRRRKYDWPTSLPKNWPSLFGEIKEFEQKYRRRHKKYPPREEIAEALDISKQLVVSIKRAFQSPLSLDAPGGKKDSPQLNKRRGPHKVYLEVRMEDALATLDNRSRQVIEKTSWGLKDWEIARDLGIEKSRVRKIRYRARKKLKPLLK